MTTWADDDDDVRDYDRRWRREEEADEQEEAIWDSIKPITVRDVDDAGNRTETVKKIRVFALTRATRPSDLRDKLVPFGMAKTMVNDETLVSKEPPLPLELGSADKCERESRAELKRLLGEYLDEFRLVGKESAAQGAEEDGGERGDGGENGTWGNNRSTMASRNRAGGHASNDVRRRVRVCNVSDDIGERDLRNIFSASGATVDRVFLAVDKETGNNRGYAFITFTEEKWVDVAVRQRRFHYRNVVLSVSYAKDKVG